MIRRRLLWCGAAVLIAPPAQAKVPLGYLRGFGPKADPVVALTWGLLIISIAVVAIISALVLAGTWLRRARVDGVVERAPVERGGNGLPWLYLGVGISTLVLVGSLVWTVVVLAAVNGPPSKPTLTVEVTGEQWWWQVRYLSDDPSQVFSTANEIHIPVGQPVRVRLIGADVIHSFWVPALTGKTDTVPGQTNETWLEARRPGRYRGQCTEYCGEQHAHMGLLVIADPPAVFATWRQAQLLPAAASPASAEGEKSFEYHCGACHTVRGTLAGGTEAPDLTHLMSRSTIAAGTWRTPSPISPDGSPIRRRSSREPACRSSICPGPTCRSSAAISKRSGKAKHRGPQRRIGGDRENARDRHRRGRLWARPERHLGDPARAGRLPVVRRSQGDRHPLPGDLLRLPDPGRHRGPGHAPAARRARPASADAGAVRPAVLDARHDDDLPLCAAGALGVQQLPLSAGAGIAGHGVPADERAVVLDLSGVRPVHVRRLRHRRRVPA